MNLFTRWSGTEPSAAVAWLKEIESHPDFVSENDKAIQGAKYYDEGRRSQAFKGRFLEDFRAAALSGLVATDPAAAQRFLESYPPGTWQAATIWNAAVSHAQTPDPVEAGNWHRVIRTLDGADRIGALKNLASYNGALPESQISPQQATGLLQAKGATPEEREQLAGMVIASYLTTKRQPTRDPVEELTEWLSQLLPDSPTRIVTEARSRQLQAWDAQAAKELDHLMNMNQDAPAAQSTLVHTLMTEIFKGPQIDQALQMAEKIQRPEQRDIVIKQIHQNSKR